MSSLRARREDGKGEYEEVQQEKGNRKGKRTIRECDCSHRRKDASRPEIIYIIIYIRQVLSFYSENFLNYPVQQIYFIDVVKTSLFEKIKRFYRKYWKIFYYKYPPRIFEYLHISNKQFIAFYWKQTIYFPFLGLDNLGPGERGGGWRPKALR